MCPSVGPLLHGSSIAARIARRSENSPRANRRSGVRSASRIQVPIVEASCSRKKRMNSRASRSSSRHLGPDLRECSQVALLLRATFLVGEREQPRALPDGRRDSISRGRAWLGRSPALHPVAHGRVAAGEALRLDLPEEERGIVDALLPALLEIGGEAVDPLASWGALLPLGEGAVVKPAAQRCDALLRYGGRSRRARGRGASVGSPPHSAPGDAPSSLACAAQRPRVAARQAQGTGSTVGSAALFCARRSRACSRSRILWSASVRLRKRWKRSATCTASGAPWRAPSA